MLITSEAHILQHAKPIRSRHAKKISGKRRLARVHSLLVHAETAHVARGV